MNPFTPGTTSYDDFEVLRDLRWHCSKCELKSGQAKTWQTWRDEYGIQFEEPTERRWEKRIFCSVCQKTTSHRKLLTLERVEMISQRSGISPAIAKKVKDLYHNEDAVFLREYSPNLLEADHKFPQIRWNQNESRNENLSDRELKEKFVALTRANNLWKSRQCERCYTTGKRGSFPGIYYWYQGVEKWDESIDPHDEEGCKGCFWYDPYRWREELRKRLEVNKI